MKLIRITQMPVVIIGKQLYMRRFYNNVNADDRIFFTTNEKYLEHVEKAKELGTYKGNLVVRQPYPAIRTMLKADNNLFAFVAPLYISANEFAIQEMYHNGLNSSAVSIINLPNQENNLPSILANDSFYIPTNVKTCDIQEHEQNLRKASSNAGLALARALHSALSPEESNRYSKSFDLPKLIYKGVDYDA